MEPTNHIITMNGIEFLDNGSLMFIKGGVGSCKSRLASSIVVGLSGKDDSIGFEYQECPIGKHVIYFSTEMSDGTLMKRNRTITNITGLDYENRFIIIQAQEIENKLEHLKLAMNTYSPHVVIIDQYADFVSSVNDETEATNIADKMAKLATAYDCGIILIMHQNESSSIQSSARGHLGSRTEQKILSSLAIAKRSNSKYALISTKVRDGEDISLELYFDVDTDLLSRLKKQPDEDIIAKLTLPARLKSVADEIGIICKASSYNTQKKIIDKLIESNKLLKKEQGNTFIISKNENDK
jgi:archaellum biogenesis ATPase FlaH